MREAPYYSVIYNDIVRQIYSGKLKIGDKLSPVRVLCEQYATGTTTVSGVIKRLADTGFIKTERGAVPVVISSCGSLWNDKEQLQKYWRDLADAYHLTCLLLPSMAAFGASQCGQADLLELRDLLDQMKSRRDSLWEFGDLKDGYIRKLLRKTNNSKMISLYEQAEENTMMSRIAVDSYWTHGEEAWRWKSYVERLSSIHEAVENAQYEQVRAQVLSLYQWIGERVLEGMRELSSQAGFQHFQHMEEFPFQQEEAGYRYEPIVSDVLDQIYAGKYQKGDLLPSEKEIRERYHVSMNTVRRAYKDLNDLDIAKTQKGKGTVVTLFSHEPDTFPLSRLEILRKLSEYWEALQLMSVTASDIALEASRNLDKRKIEEMEQSLREIWEQNRDKKAFTLAILMGELVRQTRCRTFSAYYLDIKKNLFWGSFMTGVLLNTDDEKALLYQERIHYQCLEALAGLKAGKAEKFAQQLSGIYQGVLPLIEPALKAKSMNRISVMGAM